MYKVSLLFLLSQKAKKLSEINKMCQKNSEASLKGLLSTKVVTITATKKAMMVMYFSPIESMQIPMYGKMLKKENIRKSFCHYVRQLLKTISYIATGN